jgi:hypothetical protein
MSRKRNKPSAPATQANHNSKATAFSQRVERVAHWVLLGGELTEALGITGQMLDLLHSTPQFEGSHRLLALACLSLGWWLHWQSHASSHKNGSVRVSKRAKKSRDKSKA